MSKSIGYHYTSVENWSKIRKEGLKPYEIDRPALRMIFNRPIMGIWTWLRRQSGLSHVGSILYQIGDKGTNEVVLLTYEYNEDDKLSPDGQPDKVVELPHDGWIGNLQYHRGLEQERAVIVTKAIPKRKIDLLDTFNILDAWKR